MTALSLQWRNPALPSMAPAAIIGPPGPRVGERVQSIVSSGLIVPEVDVFDLVDVTALAEAAVIATPTGEVPDGAPRLLIRIRDNGVSRALAWEDAWADGGVALPNATVAGKVHHLGFIYYASTARWMLVASNVEA